MRIELLLIIVISLLIAGCAKSDKGSHAIDNNVPSSNSGSVDKMIKHPEYKTTEAMEERNIDTFDLKCFISRFADAYFNSDIERIEQMVSQSFQGETDSYLGDKQSVLVNKIKGIENVEQDLLQKGYIVASIEFKNAEKSDYYIYLTVKIVQESDEWKVESYGLEG